MKFRNTFKQLGPGLIYAGAAVGVSHLVQSTRAGANFGFDLIWILLLVNFIKYPFFEFAPRYASSTGKSLIHGYQQLGKWAVIAFALLTLLTMFAIQAAVTVVTAGLVSYVFNINIDIVNLSAIILAFTAIVLIIGKYSALDKLMKFIIIILALSTVLAVIYAFKEPINKSVLSGTFNWSNNIHIYFLIAFIGWMPSPIDVSVWSSLWSVAKQKQLNFKPSLKQSLLDFRIGYIGTTFIALGFLLLGALVMHGSGETLSDKGSIFAGQLITMYTKSIGEWAKWIISIAAVTTMFSTTLTCMDAYPRVLKPTSEILFPKLRKSKANIINVSWILLLVTGALILLKYLSNSMLFMVDVATTLSFVTAPILAYMNYRVVMGNYIPAINKPGKGLRIYAWSGIIFLSLFTIVFILWTFIL